MSNATLVNDLRCELMTVRQSPQNARPPWASAFGPADIQFGGAQFDQNTIHLPTSGNGDYRVTPEQLQDWINQLTTIRDKAQKRETGIVAIERPQAAAPDVASAMANGSVQNTGSALRKSNDAIKSHCSHLIENFTTTLQSYLQAEQANQDSARHLEGKL